MTYFEEALECVLFSDKLFHEEVLEQLYIERDFMISCLENNIILEAEVANNEEKTSWLQKIIEVIKGIFKRFANAVKELFGTDEGWMKENLHKLDKINFNGLTVNTLEYWNVSVESIKSDLNELQKAIYRPNDRRIPKLQTPEAVENTDPFKKIKGRRNDFATGVKIHFKTGEGNQPDKVVLKDGDLQKMCLGEMKNYVTNYNSVILPTLQNAYNNLDRELKRVEKDLANANNSVKESFCLLENAFYSDTELKFCNNYDIIFEAEAPNDNKPNAQNNTEPKKENDPKLNSVQDTSKNDSNGQTSNTNAKENTSQYNTYVKIAIQFNQLALASAMTACEERYRAYMSILKGVISARAGKN